MRIFFPSVAALLTDHQGHGEGLIAWNLLSRLAERGHDVVACARQVELAHAPGFTVHETGRASRLESIEPLKYARNVRRKFESLGGADRFDIVHWLFPPGDDEILFRAAPGVPYVIGPQAISWTTSRRAFRAGAAVRLVLRPVFSVTRRRAWCSASAVLVSIPAARETIPSFSKAPSHVIPFGIDPSPYPATPLPHAPTVAFVGRLVEEKGVRDLIEAFRTVRRALPDARLLVAGEGSLRPLFEAEVTAAGADRVHLLGAVSHAEVPGILAKASVLCLPSRGEPYGMAILEAMAAGRPAVAYDQGGPSFLIDHERGGLLVPRGTGPSGLAEALLRLLEDAHLAEDMGRYNRVRVEDELSWDRIVSSLERVYERQALRTHSQASPRTASIDVHSR